MATYLVLWKVEQSRIPVDPKERGAMWEAMLDMVRKDMKKGLIKEWGTYVGGTKGFSVMQGTEVEIGLAVQQYVPYVSFQSLPVASVDQVGEIIKSLTG